MIRSTWRRVRPLVRNWGVSLALLLLLAGVVAGTASADTTPPADGSVVGLAGTPHIWVAEGGVFHWAGDTRALSGRTVRWDTRLDVSITALRTMPRGDPWLSSGLVKEGDTISLAKWETDQDAPSLLHILQIADVEAFGIDGTNYGRMVVDGRAWEEQTGFHTADLSRGTLAAAVRAAVPTATPVIPTPTAYPTPRPAILPLPMVVPSQPNDRDLDVRITGVNAMMQTFPQVTVRACNKSRTHSASNVAVKFSFWDPQWSTGLPTLDSGSAVIGAVAMGECRSVTASLSALWTWNTITIKAVTGSWQAESTSTAGTGGSTGGDPCTYASNAFSQWGIATQSDMAILNRLCGKTLPAAPDPWACAVLLEAYWSSGVPASGQSSVVRSLCGG